MDEATNQGGTVETSAPLASLDDEWARGTALVAKGNLESALIVFLGLCGRFPDHAPSYTRAGELLVELDCPLQAEPLLADAVERLPPNEWLMRAFATCGRAHLPHDQAEGRLRMVAEKFPQFGTIRADLAHFLLHGRRDVAAAEMEAERALTVVHDDTWLMDVFAHCAEIRQDWPRAADRWHTLRMSHPIHLRAYHGEALALNQLGREQDSERTSRAGLEVYPNDTMLRRLLAVSATQRRDWQAARDRWRDVRLRQADDLGGWLGEAEALVHLGEPRNAEAILAEGMSRHPTRRELAVEYAHMAERRADWPEAAVRWADARARFPDEHAAWHGGIAALRAMGQEEKAEALEAAAHGPFPDQPHYALAWARQAEQAGDAAEARRRYADITVAATEPPAAASPPDAPTPEAPIMDVPVPELQQTAAPSSDPAGAPASRAPTPTAAPPDAPASEATHAAPIPPDVGRLIPPVIMPPVPTLPERLATLWRDDFAVFRRTLDAFRAETDTPAGTFARSAFHPVTAPPQASLPLRPRIAVLVTGDLGRFREANRTWPLLRFGTADTTFFVHAWWSGEMLTDALLGGFYGTSHVAMEDAAALPFASYSEAQRDHHKLRVSWQMMAETKQSFDLVVRLQPGLMTYGVQDLDWSEILAQSLRGQTIFTDAAKSLTSGTPTIGGRFAAGASSLMAAYAGAWDRQQAQTDVRLPLFPDDHALGASLGATLFYTGIDAQPMPHVLFD